MSDYKGRHKQGDNYNVDGSAMLFDENDYPQDIRNGTTCHDGAATGARATADSDDSKMVPIRLACGSCHDGIDFATGAGTTAAGATTGHVAGAQVDDSGCAAASCHTAAAIAKAEVGATGGSLTVTLTLMDGATPADLRSNIANVLTSADAVMGGPSSPEVCGAPRGRTELGVQGAPLKVPVTAS